MQRNNMTRTQFAANVFVCTILLPVVFVVTVYCMATGKWGEE